LTSTTALRDSGVVVAGAGVIVVAGARVLVAIGARVLVAVGAGVLVAVGAGVLVAVGAGVLVAVGDVTSDGAREGDEVTVGSGKLVVFSPHAESASPADVAPTSLRKSRRDKFLFIIFSALKDTALLDQQSPFVDPTAYSPL
jgi:hypothetical protein